MTSSRYKGTDAAAYLLQHHGFEFTEEPELQRLEDLVWEVARTAAIARREVVLIAERITEGAAYVAKSAERTDRDLYEPSERGSLAVLVQTANDAAFRTRQLVSTHEAVREATRAIRMDLPTVREHGEALGRVRELEQHLTGERRKVTELLAARDEWDADERKLRAELAGALGRAEALQERFSDQQARVQVLTAQRIELERKVSDLAVERDSEQRERRAAQVTVDELANDLRDAQSSLRLSIDEYHAKDSELDGVRLELAEMTADRDRLNGQHEELLTQVDALEKANQAR